MKSETFKISKITKINFKRRNAPTEFLLCSKINCKEPIYFEIEYLYNSPKSGPLIAFDWLCIWHGSQLRKENKK